MGGGQFENLFFFKVENKEIFCQEGGGQSQNVLIFYSILSGFLKGFLKEYHPLIFPKNVCHLKTSLFRAFLGQF